MSEAGVELGIADMEVIPKLAKWECPGSTTRLGQHSQQLLEAAKIPLVLLHGSLVN